MLQATVRGRYLAKSSGVKMVYLQLKVSPFQPIEDTKETHLSASVVTDYSAIGVRDISHVKQLEVSVTFLRFKSQDLVVRMMMSKNDRNLIWEPRI